MDAWRGFTDDELACATRVVRACARATEADGRAEAASDGVDGVDGADVRARMDVWTHVSVKPLRRALVSLIERTRGEMFGGTTREEYRARRLGKAERNRRKMAERAADRAKMDATVLRSERLRRLAALEGAHGEVLSGRLIPDGAASGSAASLAGSGDSGEDLNLLRSCYVCKSRFRRLHHFYASLCPECADVNWERRMFRADMRGKVCLVTGARVKIGYRITLKLLRAGASVIATTRFPSDALKRFEEESDSADWISRLQIVALDLRDLPFLEKLCAHLLATLPRLDAVINNACQTVRRPPAYYKHLLEQEARGGFARPLAGMNSRCEFLPNAEPSTSGATTLSDWRQGEKFKDAGWMAPSAAMSQIRMIASDADESREHFPEGALDVNGQQVDLRSKNSWTMKLGEVETPELLEVLAVNAAAPFVLNGKLRPLLAQTVAMERAKGNERAAAFIINVSAMEGKFARFKQVHHPHTNMAKASLNMMTATSARDYAEDGIYMNSVDTGWINDENPLEKAARLATEQSFQTPIDEEDAAARVLAPVFDGYTDPPPTWPPPFGKFFKDYSETDW